MLYCHFVLLFVISSCLSQKIQSNKTKSLSIGCFLPGYHDNDSFGYTTALEMARDWINNNHILPENYTLELDCRETLELAANAIESFGAFLQERPRKIAFLGPVFTKALRPIAEALQLYKVLQVSFGSAHSIFNNLLEFPYFFRTVPSTEMYNWARLALFEKYHWKRFAMIYDRDNEPLTLTSSLLLKSLGMNGCTVAGSVGVSSRDDNFEQVLLNFKKQNVRIFIGDFYSVVARKVFCAAYKIGLYGQRYVWVISGNIRNRLMESHGLDCQAYDIMKASHLAVTVGQLNHVIDQRKTITGETGQELYHRYQMTAKAKNRRHHSYSSYAFDALISLGLVIRDTFYKVNWKAVDYHNHTAGQIMKNAFRKLQFQGLTGLVHYTPYSERIVDIAIQQVKDGKEELVATFDNTTQQIEFVDGSKSLVWHGKYAPKDREKLVTKLRRLSSWLSLLILTLASLGILLVFVIFFFAVKFRKQTAMKKFEPKMNSLVLAGCLLCYAAIFLVGSEGYLTSPSQIISNWKGRLWLLTTGFTLEFGSMFAKTWRIFRIMTNKSLRKKLGLISDCHLFGMVSIFFIIDITYLLLWEAFDPIKIKRVWDQPKLFLEEDIRLKSYSLACTSENFAWWIVGLLFYKALLLIIGLFLAFESRHAYAEVNNSKRIAFTVYNMVVFSIIGTITSFALRNHQQEFTSGIISFSVLLCTTVTIVIMFIPRLIALKQNSRESRYSNARSDAKSCPSQQVLSTSLE